MKPTQTVVLLVILLGIVFGVTFASMYVRQTPPKPGPGRKGEKNLPARRLTFASDRFGIPAGPGDDFARLVSEVGGTAYHDFWFKNENDEDVLVGLNSKNCDCSDVELFIAPDGWRKDLAVRAGQQLGLLSHTVLPAVISAGAAPGSFHTLAKEGGGVTVPARAAGFVRVAWKGRFGTKAPKGQLLKADLWMQTPGSVPVTLQVGVLLVDAVRVDTTTVEVGTLGRGDSAEGTMRCWSSTRPDFDFAIRSLGTPLIVCRKEKLTAEDSEELARKFGQPVVAGFRVRVTVLERTKDGKHRLDQGPFSRTITLVPPTARGECLHLTLSGIVRGDINVTGGSSITLQPFASSRGTHHEVTLTTERTDLKLKRDHSPKFMKVELKKEAAGRWRLILEIEPGKVAGSFPRADNDLYRDTAIYLKIEGEGGRRLRIPVSGKADQ